MRLFRLPVIVLKLNFYHDFLHPEVAPFYPTVTTELIAKDSDKLFFWVRKNDVTTFTFDLYGISVITDELVSLRLCYMISV